jgi:hypothetical protein
MPPTPPMLTNVWRVYTTMSTVTPTTPGPHPCARKCIWGIHDDAWLVLPQFWLRAGSEPEPSRFLVSYCKSQLAAQKLTSVDFSRYICALEKKIYFFFCPQLCVIHIHCFHIHYFYNIIKHNLCKHKWEGTTRV